METFKGVFLFELFIEIYLLETCLLSARDGYTDLEIRCHIFSKQKIYCAKNSMLFTLLLLAGNLHIMQ
jgi:hypothetical protein